MVALCRFRGQRNSCMERPVKEENRPFTLRWRERADEHRSPPGRNRRPRRRVLASNSEESGDDTRHVSCVKCGAVNSGAKCASAVQGVIALVSDAISDLMTRFLRSVVGQVLWAKEHSCACAGWHLAIYSRFLHGFSEGRGMRINVSIIKLQLPSRGRGKARYIRELCIRWLGDSSWDAK